MMKKFFLFLFLPLSLKSQKILSDKKECPPCEIIYNDNNIKEKLDSGKVNPETIDKPNKY